ncbi:MAG TPA: hypothetical protein VFU05_19365 [Cyclobacteriaceae bacterium]|nr:hypothetical protein [Cyclobacteriaceae bacterium]
MKLLIDILGWIASISILAAYALNSYQKIKSDSYTFLILNILGGVCFVIYTFYLKAYANTFLNVVWVIIAIPALVKVIRKSKSTA